MEVNIEKKKHWFFYLAVVLLDIKTQRSCSFLDFRNYLIRWTFGCESRFPFNKSLFTTIYNYL